MTPALEARRLSKQFHGRKIIAGASLRVKPAGRIALLGASGSGKTTLLRMLCGLLKPDGGEVVCDGELVASSSSGPPHQLKYRSSVYPNLTMVFQEPRLFPNLTARENCLLGFDETHRTEIDLLMFELAESLDIAERLNQRPSELSQGERQRFAIIRALVRRPKYLLLDEPTAALDPFNRKMLANLLNQRFPETGLLFSTHDWEFASSIASSYLTIWRSRVRRFRSLHAAVDRLAGRDPGSSPRQREVL